MNVLSMAAPSRPDGAPPPFGPMMVQKIEWFECPPALLRSTLRTSSGTELNPRSRSSTDFLASSGCFSNAAFALLT